MRESILRATELFLDKSESQRTELIRIVIEGHLRGLIGQRTFEDLVQDPEAVMEAMFKTTQADLDRMGLEMVSFTLQGIHRWSPD
jgi:flotillin